MSLPRTTNARVGTVADTFTFATTAYLSANDSINGGNGADTLILSEAAAKTITAAQLSGLSSIGAINLDGVTAANSGAISITLSAAVATSMAESGALSVYSLNASSAIDDTGTITIDASTVGSDVALTLSGAGAADTITGGAGNDIITGNAGNDSLTGGTGNDTFVLNLTSTDTITDFNFGTSTTSVDILKIAGLGAAAVTEGAVVGTSSSAAGDYGVLVLTAASYGSAAAAAIAANLIDNSTTEELIIVYQDSLGKVQVAYDPSSSVDGGNEVNIATLTGISIASVASLINAGDFIFAA
jgi:Ca2+-binding RTX toxin-like protein